MNGLYTNTNIVAPAGFKVANRGVAAIVRDHGGGGFRTDGTTNHWFAPNGRIVAMARYIDNKLVVFAREDLAS